MYIYEEVFYPFLSNQVCPLLQLHKLIWEVYDESETYDYYLTALKDGSHSAFLVFDRGIFVGAGGISFYRVMPTFHNTTGKKAYIMNMYTHPDYRRRGIACHVLQLLTEEAKEKGVSHITLEATKAGRYLYEKFGFVRMEDEMILPQE